MSVETENGARTIHIALQDGFEVEPVIVLVNGTEVFQQEDVQTDYRISLAHAFDVPRPDGPVRVEVLLPGRQLSDSIELEEEAAEFVGVSYQDGALRFRLSVRPFGYL